MKRITKLLVANRGEIARRVVRTAQEMGIATVAVFSDADEGAPHVTEAREAVRLPGTSPAATYLRIDLLVEAARRTGADAVHPGYGFLSENAAFARACIEAGLTWVGPPPAAITALGSKVEAKQVMEAAGVPVLPWREVPTGLPPAEVSSTAEAVGYPILVKAAFGGGGRGMRVVRTPDELAAAVTSAGAEAASAFGDGTVFIERFVESPRHVEIQVLADEHGAMVHLFERECSIQRRYQKVIEEAPSPALDADLRAEMGAAAIIAAKAVGYVGAGTVEFVLGPDGRFAFLEVNTRLQVEHPVTEMITGLDLVRLQLEIAQGVPLPPEAVDASMEGHAVEARLYAEDPANNHLPTSGILHRFRFPSRPGLRVDSGYVDGSAVTTNYDAMLAKVIAWAPTRSEAVTRLASALEDAEIHGVVTNRELLVATLRHREFGRGDTDTGFLDRNASDLRRLPTPRRTLEIHGLAAALVARTGGRRALPTPPGIPDSWRNVGPATQTMTFEAEGGTLTVGSALDGVAVVESSAEHVVFEAHGVRLDVRVHPVGEVSHCDSALGSTSLRRRPRFPVPESGVEAGSLLSPLPGTVVSVLVATGDRVAAGDQLAVVEAMKMQHTVRAPHAGTVTHVVVTAGAQVDAGAVLLVLDADG